MKKVELHCKFMFHAQVMECSAIGHWAATELHSLQRERLELHDLCMWAILNDLHAFQHSLEGRFICNHKSAALFLGTNTYLKEQRFKLCIK